MCNNLQHGTVRLFTGREGGEGGEGGEMGEVRWPRTAEDHRGTDGGEGDGNVRQCATGNGKGCLSR